MKNFAKILIAVGIVIAGLSVILLGYNTPGSASYQMCIIDVIIGLIMLAFGSLYLWIYRNKQK